MTLVQTICTELEAEIAAFQRLSSVVRSELDALCSQDHEHLSELVAEKEALLSKLDTARQRREQLVRSECKRRATDAETLEGLIATLETSDAQTLIRLRLSLLQHLERLRTMNRTGRRYVRRQIRFLAERKAVLSGEPTANTGEYLSSGTTRNIPTQGIALDVRV